MTSVTIHIPASRLHPFGQQILIEFSQRIIPADTGPGGRALEYTLQIMATNLAIAVFLGTLLALVPTRAQTMSGLPAPLNNDAILKLSKAGMGTELIVAMVNNQPGNYTLDPDSVIALKAAGLPEKVITAMVTHAGNLLKGSQSTGAGGAMRSTPPPVRLGAAENGVYRPRDRVGRAEVQEPRIIYEGSPSKIVWQGNNVCGGALRATYVVATDGRPTDVSVEGVHYVYEAGQLSVVDGADGRAIQCRLKQSEPCLLLCRLAFFSPSYKQGSFRPGSDPSRTQPRDPRERAGAGARAR